MDMTRWKRHGAALRDSVDRGRILRRAGVVALLLIVPGLALAASVKGRVVGTAKLLNPVWNEAKDPAHHRYTFREPSPTVRADVRTLTGYLPRELAVVAVGGTTPAPKAAVLVAVSGGRTTPVTIVMSEGQAIQFTNNDPFPHKLYDVAGKGLLPNELGPTKTRSWTPPGPGKYEIRDESAPSVRSWVVVLPQVAATAYPDRKGEFSIALEPGQYTLRSYFNGEAVGQEQTVIVAPAPAEQLLKQPLSAGAPEPVAEGGK
jgi:hypothetical protein